MKPGSIVKIFKSEKGNEVMVRFPTKDDLRDMHEYINKLSREDTFLSVLGRYYSLKEEKDFLLMTLANIKKGNTRHYAVFVNNEYAGNCEIERGKEHRQQHIGALGISLRKKYRGEGIGKELFHMLIEEGKDMGLRLLKLSCFENNPVALNLYETLGFQRAGIIPGAFLYKGGYVGEVIMYLSLV
ncbi:GNAT family N-acetyltransferase [Candidatus Gottesmanbacteria bacterium]|nr:GNAT family N-acetyltransferase [Candidatus Gottesmanbacteria bacterium]